jgi:hypothetical protein
VKDRTKYSSSSSYQSARLITVQTVSMLFLISKLVANRVFACIASGRVGSAASRWTTSC